MLIAYCSAKSTCLSELPELEPKAPTDDSSCCWTTPMESPRAMSLSAQAMHNSSAVHQRVGVSFVSFATVHTVAFSQWRFQPSQTSRMSIGRPNTAHTLPVGRPTRAQDSAHSSQ